MVTALYFRIGHDNKGGGGAWFLDKVVIDAPSLGRTWVFPCGHWLSDSDEDRLLERELFPQELATEVYRPCESAAMNKFYFSLFNENRRLMKGLIL